MNDFTAVITTLLPLLISCVVFGIISHMVAGKKGYSGYFWTGFFLLVIGAVYVAALPVATSRLSSDEQRLLDHYRSLDTAGKRTLFDTLRIH